MLNQILNTARAAVQDINNYLKSNAEISMDFMLRLNGQGSSLETIENDPASRYSKLASVNGRFDSVFNETENYGCFEENY